MNILIVEDDESSRIFLERFLLSQGYAVESAGNGVEALSKCEQALPDLVISDIMMPEMDGFELCRRMKTDERFRAVPFVFYTATFIENKDRQLALALGASRFLVKPMELDDLLAEIRALIDEFHMGKLDTPVRTIADFAMLDRMQLEVLARKLDKKVADLNEEHESLQRSEDRYHRLLDSMMDGFACVGMDGRIIQYNRAFRQMLGYDDEELKSLTYRDLTPEKWLEYEQQIIDDYVLVRGYSDIYTKEYRKKDGSVIPVELNTYLITNDKGEKEGMWAIVRDITERKKSEEEKKKLEAQLLQAQKMEAIGALAGGVAHDFNNILNVIMGYGYLVMDMVSSDDSLAEPIQEILAAADRAANLTRQLLVFSKKREVSEKIVDINEIIAGIQKMLARLIGEHIELKVCLTDRRLTVMADVGQIEQALMNLASNARDAMPKGGSLTIMTEAEVMDDAHAKAFGDIKSATYAIINVADTGTGMDAETQAKIFDPFFTTKETGKGTGLGLAISYGIVKQYGGRITCYSELGKGSVFRIYLPLISSKEVSIPDANPPETVTGGSETILFAEDDPHLREMGRTVLESFGYSVITAEDGEDALRKFFKNEDTIKLTLLDLIMPKKGGLEVYSKIRKNAPQAVVLFMSGYSRDMIRGIREDDKIEIIRKPFTPSAMLRKIREILDRGGA